jgi:hypothetical protein
MVISGSFRWVVVVLARVDDGGAPNSSPATPMNYGVETGLCRDDRIRDPGADRTRRPARSLRDAGGTGPVRCDVGSVEPDAVTVDALARLQLAARRRGCRVLLENASADLLGLVELMGLSNVLGDRPIPTADRR